MSYLYKTSFTGCRYCNITNNRKLLLKMNIRQNISINHKKKLYGFGRLISVTKKCPAF